MCLPLNKERIVNQNTGIGRGENFGGEVGKVLSSGYETKFHVDTELQFEALKADKHFVN
jgi:hypothetical protein